MKSAVYIGILLLGAAFSGFAENYYLSICAVFQNEAPYLSEWIEYHRLMGVEHFYLYNNLSQDHFFEVLSPYIEQGVVELRDWPPQLQDWAWDRPGSYQAAAYKDCLTYCSTHWLAVIDIDEFIVPVKQPDLLSFLEQLDQNPAIGGIQVNWQIYGTSGLSAIPSGKLLVESLLWKAKFNFYKHEQVKSIVRPSTVARIGVHNASYKQGFFSWPRRTRRTLSRTHINEIRINHYWTRAEDFFYTTKAERMKRKWGDRYLEVMQKNSSHLNEVYDPILLSIVPKLKERLQK